MAYVMARPRRMRLAPTAEPNVIPFIDVLLVLLIIFMVTAPKPDTDLRVDLPRAAHAPAAIIRPTLVELRAENGAIRAFVCGAPVAAGMLGARTLACARANNPTLSAATALADTPIFVRADLDVSYQAVVATIEELQSARFAKVAISAQRA